MWRLSRPELKPLSSGQSPSKQPCIGFDTIWFVSKQRFQTEPPPSSKCKMPKTKSAIRKVRAEQQGVAAQLLDSAVSNHPSVEKAKSRLRRAFLDYRRRNVVAPVAGYIAKRMVQFGDNLLAGAPLPVIVSLDEVWVEANFLETQVAEIRLGQRAEIRVDAYHGDRRYHGRVQGMSPATGSTFAILPADNSTGNFIHIAERLQVRIALEAGKLAKHPLQPGLSTLCYRRRGSGYASEAGFGSRCLSHRCL